MIVALANHKPGSDIEELYDYFAEEYITCMTNMTNRGAGSHSVFNFLDNICWCYFVRKYHKMH